VKSTLKQRWDAGDVTFGGWCAIPSSLSAEIIGKAGFDWVLIDMQHGCMGYETAVEMIRAIDLGPSVPIVRVPANDPAMIGRMLDAGAMGIIVPMINSAEEARAVVDACRYPPLGQRSLGPFRVQVRDGRKYVPEANERIAVIPMIETLSALEAVEEIAAVPGVDALFVGPFDLSFALGLRPGDNDGEPAFDDAVTRIGKAARASGIATAVLSNPQLAPIRAEQGFQMISVAMDNVALAMGAAAALKTAQDEITKDAADA
jgi:4-hydroxy-2-oxoheptanedioate aldolase